MSWDQLLFAFEKGRRLPFQPVLQDVFCVLVTPQSLTSQKFLEVKKQVIIT